MKEVLHLLDKGVNKECKDWVQILLFSLFRFACPFPLPIYYIIMFIAPVLALSPLSPAPHARVNFLFRYIIHKEYLFYNFHDVCPK